MFCNPLLTTTKTTTTAAFVVKIAGNDFKHICTDGDPAMVGTKGGATLVKNEWPRITLYMYALATKTLPTPLMKMMNCAVKVIKHIPNIQKKQISHF